MKLPRSLQGRMTLLVLGAVTLVWCVAAVGIWLDARQELDELLDSHLAQAAALLVAQQGLEADEVDREIDAPSLHRYAPAVAFQVLHEGRPILRSANAPTAPMVVGGGDARTGFSTVSIEGIRWRVFAAHGAERDVQVYVGERMDSRAEILWAVLRSSMRPLALMLPLLGAAVWWSVRRGVRPLRTLGQLLRARTPGGLAPVTVAGAPAEMDPLLEALNGLLLRIAALMESERRFTADAAHELRTPIAAIRAQAQVAQAEPDGALRQHALQAVLQGCDRAARLVEQLLTLSRMDSGATPPQSEVDLTRCTREVLASLAPTALARQQDLDFLATEPVTVFADPTLLAVLVRNLLDNAVRYSPNGATIRVAISSEPSRVCWGVDDSGPGLEAADLARLGERFFRVLGTGQDGSGMGWSIVHRIAVIQGATVTVGKSAALGGLAVRVEWPLRGLPGAGDQALR